MKQTERNGGLVGFRGAQGGAQLRARLQVGVVAGRRLLRSEVSSRLSYSVTVGGRRIARLLLMFAAVV